MRDERVPLHTKVLYGIGDITNTLFNTIVAVYFLKFLTDVVGLDPLLAGAAIFIGKSVDWINDPIIGHLSDRTRTRWGRRRPFLLLGIIPLALAFTFFFWIPPWENPIALAAYYGLMFALLDTAATFVYMPYYALTPELTLDYDERTSLTTTRMFFSILGSLVAFTTPLLIVDAFANPRTGYFVMALFFGVAGVLPLLFTFFGTRERPEFQAQAQPSLRESLMAVRHNRPFRFGLGMFLLTWTTLDIIQVILLYFIQYWLHMESIAELILGSVFVSAAIFLPLWNWISGKWDKRKAYIVGMTFFAAIMIVLVLIGPETPVPVVFVITTLAGIGVAAAHVISWAILPDAIEWSELQTGRRDEGAFYSLVTLAQKVASSIAVPLTAWALGLSGYQPNAAEQVPSALFAIRGLTGGIPAIMMLGGITFALLYPLSREGHADIRQKLVERRAKSDASS